MSEYRRRLQDEEMMRMMRGGQGMPPQQGMQQGMPGAGLIPQQQMPQQQIRLFPVMIFLKELNKSSRRQKNHRHQRGQR